MDFFGQSLRKRGKHCGRFFWSCQPQLAQLEQDTREHMQSKLHNRAERMHERKRKASSTRAHAEQEAGEEQAKQAAGEHMKRKMHERTCRASSARGHADQFGRGHARADFVQRNLRGDLAQRSFQRDSCSYGLQMRNTGSAQNAEPSQWERRHVVSRDQGGLTKVTSQHNASGRGMAPYTANSSWWRSSQKASATKGSRPQHGACPAPQQH